MTKDTLANVSPLPIGGSLILFGTPTLLMWLTTRSGIPVLRPHLGGPDIFCWFVAGGSVFFCLFAAAFVAFWIEQGKLTLLGFADRFRLSSINSGDAVWSVGTLIVCGLLSAGIAGVWTLAAQTWGLLPELSLTPSFIQVEPLTENRTSILLVWFPLFFFNITGEELWWRGYILPRQEQQHRSSAWLVHGCGLTLFHLPLGVDLSIILLPFLFGLPYVVQRRKNLWTGFLVHGILNGGGFLAVVAGLA
jgi:membrane protease YdiL (CAAX protease family)